MSDPKTIFTDAQLGVIELLAAQLPTANGGAYAAATIHDSTDDHVPHVMVRQDETPENRYPAAERCVVRVTTWASSEFQAKLLGQHCRAIILSTAGTNLIRATSPLSGPVPGLDPDTREPLASFTVSVQTRPLPA